MKKFLLFLAVAAFAAGFTSCLDSPDTAGIETGMIEISLTADAALDLDEKAEAPRSRAIMDGDKTGGYKSDWEVGDKIGIMFEGIDGRQFPLEIRDGGIVDGKATFCGSVPGEVSGRKLTVYIYYPYTDGLQQDNTVKVNIPYEQNKNRHSYDPRAHVMTGRPATLICPAEGEPSVVNLRFRNHTAFINLRLKDDAGRDARIDLSDRVLAVEYEAPQGAEGANLTGDFFVDPMGGTMTQADGSGSNKVKVYTDANHHRTIRDLIDEGVWMSVAPACYDGTRTSKMTVYTASYTITKEFTVQGNIEINPGKVKFFNMTLNGDAVVTPVPLYYEGFSGNVPGSGSRNQSISEYKGYDKAGSGSRNLAYSGTSGTQIRQTNTIAPHIWLPPLALNNFIVSNIALNGIRDLNFSYRFRVNQSNTTDPNDITYEIYISNDGNNWHLLRSEITRIAAFTERNLDFSIVSPEGPLYIKLEVPATNPEGVRLDEFELTALDSPSPNEFDLDSAPPLEINVETLAATGASTPEGSSATIHGKVEVKGLSRTDVLVCGFQWALTTEDEYTYNQTAVPNDEGEFSLDLTGLTPGSEYNFRAWAKVNDGPEVYGDDLAFTPVQAVAGPDRLTILPGDFTTKSYADNDGSHSKDSENGLSVSYTSQDIFQNSKAMQWRSKKGQLYNTTDLGNILTVVVTLRNASDSPITVYCGAAEISSRPGSSPLVPQVTGSAYTYTVPDGNGFLFFEAATALAYTASLEINFIAD